DGIRDFHVTGVQTCALPIYEVGDRVPFVPGTGSAKLDETLELTAAARDAGADAVLVITPYYARPTQEALYAWYSTVAREFPDLRSEERRVGNECRSPSALDR